MTLYEILGVEVDATTEQITAAFRRKVKDGAHPDKGGDPQEFMRLLQAREVLSDPEKRAEYDRRHDGKQRRLDEVKARVQSQKVAEEIADKVAAEAREAMRHLGERVGMGDIGEQVADRLVGLLRTKLGGTKK